MFKKRQIRSIRRKPSDDEDDNNNGDARSDSESRGSNGSASLKDQKKVAGADTSRGSITKSMPSTSSLLSFGDEDEEETFQVRKSAASRNLERARHRQRAAESSGKEKSKPAGLRSSTKAESQKADDVIIVKQVGSFGRKTEPTDEPATPIILSGREAEHAEEEPEEKPMMGKFKDVLTSGAIPDANLIHMARKQRQMAREMGTEAPGSYVPLKKVDDTQKYKKVESRIIREDDDNENSDSGEEAGRFYSKLRDEDEEERRKVEADFLRVEQGDSDEERDDELDRWEKEQIRKGVSKNQLSYFGQEYVASNFGSAMSGLYASYVEYEHSVEPSLVKEIKEPQPMEIDMDLAADEDEVSGVQRAVENQRISTLPKVGGGPQPKTESITSFRDVMAKLEQRQSEQKAMHSTRLLECEKIRDHLTENESASTKLQESVPLLSAQHRFYQEMRTYVRDLLDCFNEKVPLIEQLATRMMELWTSRSYFLIRRRQQDLKDQYEECSAASSGKMQLLQRDSDRMMRAAEREARRTRRRQAREKTLASLGHHEGMSSDDEEAPSRIVNFNSEKEKIALDSAEIFKDTVEEFYNIEDILRRFVEWRKSYKDSFDQAYIVYCLPKLLAPVIQWRILDWYPLESGAASLNSMDWYASLERTEQSQRDMYGTDDEFDLVFPVMDVAVLPRLKGIVEHVWDPTSSSQTTNLAAFMSNLLRDHPKSCEDGKNFEALKEAIRVRIRRSFDDDLFTPIYSKDTVDNKATGASAFLDRQFWFSLKVIHNISAWTPVFSEKEIKELIFDGVVNRHVVLGLQCGGSVDITTLTKCKAICNALPASWFSDLKENESMAQMEPLCKMLVRIADELNSSKTLEKSSVKDATKEIHRLLLKLHGRKHAETLSQKYRIK